MGLEVPWYELRGRVRGLVNTAHLASEPVRADMQEAVAVISPNLASSGITLEVGADDSFILSFIPLHEPYEDAVFSEGEDGGVGRWPYVSMTDMLDAESLIDCTRISALDVEEALDVLDAWSRCD